MAATPPRVHRLKRSRLRRQAARKLLPVLLVFCLGVLIAVVAGGSTVRRDIGCGFCHMEYITANRASEHRGLTCADCHASAGLTGIFADGIRAMRWLAVSPFRDARPSFAPEGPCRDCHSLVLTSTVTSFVAVRHSDFIDERCVRCHAGSGHRLEERWYARPLMEDCTGCHRVSVTNIKSCELCHTKEATGNRRKQAEGDTVFQASHGGGWERAHGMGDLSHCGTCHLPTDCADCHGVPLPHQQGWQRIHGKGMPESIRPQCETCHAPEWCTACHGVEMPHVEDFLPVHGELAESDSQVCYRCHTESGCVACHFSAEHTQVPGIDYHTGAGEPE